MSQRKDVKDRICRNCGESHPWTAREVKAHYKECIKPYIPKINATEPMETQHEQAQVQ